MNKNYRIFQIDNIKCILIFLVVFGHLCEQMTFRSSKFLYLLIYSFHMPAFAFISGFCCKKTTGEILIAKYLYPYIVFQTCYIAFAKYILHETINLQYTTPYWILWYLLAIFFWNTIISIFSDSERILILILISSYIIALLVGYDDTVSYYLSLSRIVVMLPFFVSGYYLKKKNYQIFKSDDRKINVLPRFLTIFCVVLVCGILYLAQNKMQASWAYHSIPYHTIEYSVWNRAFFLITSGVFITFLCMFIPNKNLGIITNIGQNTIGIFLIHGFIIRYLTYKNILQTLPFPQLSIILLSIIILLACSSRLMIILLKPLIIWPVKRK
ncbi:MAG: acyltransferase family protein [Lachnospiraceae bacterium]|nr:acyltransferase family protein [Lachnospiraceae bacterium]